MYKFFISMPSLIFSKSFSIIQTIISLNLPYQLKIALNLLKLITMNVKFIR